jgi:voltage-gated potassium channel
MFETLRRRMRQSQGVRYVVIALAILVGVLVTGVVGYILIEDMTFTQALYMTVITISTVGFREVRPLGIGGMYFTIAVVIMGFGALLFFLTGLFEFVLSEYLGDYWGRRRMQNTISKLENHYIICGYGRVGRSVAIEKDEGVFQGCVDDGYLAIHGSATDNLKLAEAGIEKAVGLVSALRSDADNLYVMLTARVQRPEILLVARADQPESEEKLEMVGADRVISPHKIAGKRMANLMVRPGACEFLDVVAGGNLPEYQLSELSVTASSPLAGKTIKGSRLRETTGVTILSVRKMGEAAFNANPATETMIEDGDVLILIGTPEQMAKMEASSRR